MFLEVSYGRYCKVCIDIFKASHNAIPLEKIIDEVIVAVA